MTDYNTYELSTMDSEPIELYKFQTFNVDNTVTREWYYCNNFEDIDYGGNTYLAMQIKRSKIEQSGNPDENQLTITINSSARIVDDNIISYADENIKVTVYRQQQLTYTNTIFTGYLVEFKIGELTSQLGCDSGLSTTRRPVLFYIYSQQCGVPLYSTQCGVVKETFKDEATCIGISGTTLYFEGSNTEESGFYKAGIIETTDGQMRTIQAHYGNRVILLRPFRDINVGDVIYLYRGCDHTKESCADIFNNILNYKGFPFMPDRSPFTGNGVK